ncbi:uncharacterized protein N7518_008057 [Penicillium psychrosexuale]|uniref:uncharacterized protein n=1 Tax=Penicillium psychrosexuale TaxID=1002107 RepID=UPI002544EBB7|nr:uncharacterized protein N7518_008057 [Penicillium psychrosexuale]KAJ5791046.1 hypothetical protein N7518_008057 [Penicillium psychrosexuale]
MDHLPLEIRHIIADWTGHISKESLRALCLVNRKWHEIAKALLSKHIIIRLREGRTPDVPDDRRILTQARQLSIVAEWTPGSHSKRFVPKQIDAETSKGLDQYYSDICRSLEGAFLEDQNFPKAGFYVGGDWSPVIDLIRRIPHLHDVNIFVFYGGPVELFEALSQYHPACRVSFFSTVMRQHPLREAGMFPIINPVWLSSPMLYAAHLTALEDSDRGPLFRHPDRLLQNIALHAPNLKKIALRIDGRCYGQTIRGQLDRIKVDNGAKSDGLRGLAKIETMSWPLGMSEMTALQFQDWQTITDFSVLRSLNLGCITDWTILQSIADDHPFRQLKRLTIALFPQKDDRPRFWQASESMFTSLPPLTYLCLMGMYTPEFANNVIGHKHGKSLLELGLHGEIGPKSSSGGISLSELKLCRRGRAGPIFSAEHVRELANHCPSIQNLQICIQRYPDAQTDMSSALGRFACLKKLYLVLNCLPEIDANMMPVPLRELTDFEKGLASDVLRWGSDTCPRWFIRDYMINCDISEIFVTEFFTQIRTAQKNLVQLVMTPIVGEWAKYSKSDQYSWVPFAVMKFLIYCPSNNFASVWVVKEDHDTELHAIRKKPFYPPSLDGKYSDDILSIFCSTGIWNPEPEVKT